GGLGNDVIFAAGGNDHVFGGAGNDLISAMRGYNTLTGGEGRNHFSVHTEGKTVITDFSYLNGDTLDFRGVYTGTSEIISRVSILDYQGSGTDRDLMIWHANGGYTILLGAANLVSVLDEVLPSLTHDAAELVLQVDAETGVPFDPQTSEGHMIPHARPDAGAAATIFAEASGDDISTDQDNPHLVGGAGNDTLTVTPAGTSVDHDIWAGGGRNTVDIQSGVTGVVSIHDYTSADTIRVDGSDLDLAVLPGGTVVEDRPTGITVIYQNGLTLHIFDEAIADAYESDPDRNTIGDDFEAAFDPDAPAPEGRVEPDYPTTPDPVEPVDPDPVDPVDPDPVDPVDPDPVDPVEPDPVDPDAPLTNPSLGIGLNGVTDWSTQSPFIDVFKTSRPWVGHTTEGWGSLAQEEMDAILDENGYMTEMPDGASGVSAIFLTEMPAEMTSIAGRYRMTFDGEAEFRLLGASNVTFGEGEVWFDYTPSGNNMISLDITSIGTDYMRNISVVHESNIEAFEAGEIFNPDWIDLISDMRVLRYMDWQRTNNSDLSTWEDRAEADDATWATDAGVPLEVMIELANQTGTDPWFNIPHMADEAFIREFVTYVRNNLDPELQPHFEYSNEVWNWQFEQAQWAHDMGQQEWPDTGSAWVQYYAQKASEMAQIIDDVYGPDVNDMVKKIISTQTGWEGLEGDILTAPQWVEASGEDEPYTNFNAYGVTGYFSGGLGGDKAALVKDWIAQSRERAAFEGGQIGLTGAELEEYIEEHKFDTAIAVAAAELRDGSVTGDPQDTLEDLFASFEYHKSVADAHGLDLIMYEGGTHIVGINGNQDDEELTEFFTALNASDQMGQLYIELLAGWMDAGGTLFNAFVDVGRHSKHGSWGALEHLDDSSARWDALVEFNRENPGWWEERGQDDFLGSTEGDEVEPIDPVDPDPV
ncbi:MAG: hypothetical protein ABJN42_08160, partial [Roseibium sp.]|uniref:hypothetical protein n=1 Tax=Roseibium sp. TaxID=1936156 RepID=UPI003299B5B0